MNVALVTTYPPMECGIGIYTRKLVRPMVADNDDISIFIVGEGEAGNTSETGIKSQPVFSRMEDYQDKIFDFVHDHDIDLVHFEHSPDIFGMDYRLPDLLGRLKKAGIKTVVTLHTVYDRPKWREETDRRLERDSRKMNDADFHRALAEQADSLIVHQRKGAVDVLVSHGVDESKLSVIPHGTTEMERLDTNESKRLLGLDDDAFLFLFFGQVHIQKNVHTAVMAFLRIAKHYPKARLVVAGKPFGNRSYNRAYIFGMRMLRRLFGKRKQIIIRDNYVPEEEVDAYFSSADVILLPHWQKYGSASGVFHQAIGAKKPIIVSDGPKFSDGVELLKQSGMDILTPPAGKPGKWSQAMARLMDDSDFYQRATSVLSQYATESLWPNVAAKHVRIYRELLSDQT